MDELVQAPSTTVLDAGPLRPRHNHLLQGVLSFLAVVGIGAALTVTLHPPTRVRVITVEKRVPGPVVHTIERVVEKPVVVAPAARPTRVATTTPRPKPPVAPLRTQDCNEPLCGLDNLKQ